MAERVQPYAFDTNWSILSKELINRCHAKGIKVFSDALRSHETVEDYQQAIRDGIDLIQTDHPGAGASCDRAAARAEVIGPVCSRPHHRSTSWALFH